jgi:hypothetical protein
MDRKKLIITDLLLIIGIVLLTYASDGFKNKAIMPLALLIISALASCVLRHVNYYKLTKKIY